MTDQQFEDRYDVLVKLLTAIDPNTSIANVARDLAEVRGEIAELKMQLSNIESSIRAIKTLVG